jgi:hypothetical protein
MASASMTPITIPDGSLDFSGGVDSVKVTTIQSQQNPNGLNRNQLAWLDNCGVRDGGITQRNGWQYLLRVHDSTGLYQGGAIYEPDSANPYLVLAISGHIYKVLVEDPFTVTDLSVLFGLFMPPTLDHFYFVQGENYLIIQAGDLVTLPLFWDGSFLRRSFGLIGTLSRDDTTLPVTQNFTTTAPFTVPAINSNVTVSVTAGSIGNDTNKTFTLTDDPPTTAIALFKVISVNKTTKTEVWKNLNSGFVGITFPAGGYIGTLTSPAQYTAYPSHSWVVPNAGGSVVISLVNGPYPNNLPYPGNVGDDAVIQTSAITTIGEFIVTAFTATTITLRLVSSSLSGGTVPASDTLYFTITSPVKTIPANAINEIPAAQAMDYFMGRIWYAQNRQYSAGDIVGGTAGTVANHFRDSILCVTENPLCFGGDGFTVPTNAGNIRAIKHSSQLDANLGQGSLYIGTRKAIYSLEVPVTRDSWIAAGNNNQPKQVVAQLTNGFVNDRSVVPVNGDLYYQSLEPSIRSLILANRYFQTAGNIEISNNENRILQFVDRGLLHAASGIYFDNRLLQTSLPKQLPQGIIHQAIIPLDFVPMSDFGANLSPTWEGHWEGLQVLQLFSGDFGGRERAFAVVVSELDGAIEVWELTDFLLEDVQRPGVALTAALTSQEATARVTWYIETPAFTWGAEFSLKELQSLELWFDQLFGTVMFTVEYRPDGDACWHPWHKFQLCSAKNTCEDVDHPICYPAQGYGPGFRQTVTLPKPKPVCESSSGRPSNILYQCQVKLTIKGFCRLRGFLIHATKVERPLYAGLVC